ncbi:LINE-1 retrotransposable element ORF2 protein [Durusdinium trenchii]|uniref:LINE-1 retrotransposable element ORF2 protein n=1 Tax=Durusdinium trenchii TaxID=1381693 RepID=A0ABP0J3X0_9DINO
MERVGYIYFSDHASGSYLGWPAVEWCQADDYDPRLRPYSSGSTGPKDVVIVIDVSGSMQTAGRYVKAKQAAKALIDTLEWKETHWRHRDRVAEGKAVGPRGLPPLAKAPLQLDVFLTGLAATRSSKTPWAAPTPLRDIDDFCPPVPLVYGASGPRYISGDFNGTPADYPDISLWLQEGWIEAQDLRMHHTGELPEHTCKAKTRPDRIYLSPELAHHFQTAQLHHSFVDHSVLEVRFNLPEVPLRYQWWPMPLPLPWADISLHEWTMDSTPAPSPDGYEDITHFYQDFGSAYERSFAAGLASQRLHLPTHCRGRGQTLEPQWRDVQMPVLKRSREGEVTPATDFLNRQMIRWFQQLRRIQSLLHNLRAMSPSAGAVEYRILTWRAVWKAKGFDGTFADWWTCRPIVLQSSPTTLPLLCPSADIMHNIFLDFQANYQSLESWHYRNRQRALRLKYQENTRLAFSVVRTDRGPPMQHLSRFEKAEILEVEPSSCLVHVDRPMTASTSSTWFLDDCPATVERLDDHTLRVHADLLLCPGQEICQKIHSVHTADMLRELSQFWRERWQRHAHVPPEAWHRILAFTKHFVPAPPLRVSQISVAAWDAINQRYTDRSARGPDGFDHNDLCRMPPRFKESLVAMFGKIECTGQWPAQILRGFGLPLPKCLNAEETHQFRPIIILSMLYRSWASHHSRALLAQLSHYVGSDAKGFLPKREAGQLWHYIQALVEVALQERSALAGCVGDIIKAFENVPRRPLIEVCRILGIPDSLLRPWQSFLDNFQRHFVLHGQLGDALSSSAGLPEGCGLSVLGMTIVDWVYDIYHQRYVPNCRSFSFVDNFDLVSTQLSHLFQGAATLQSYLSLWGLELDSAKTFFWAVQSTDRELLRRTGLTVRLQAADLGGAMMYCRRRAAGTQLHRIQQLLPHWQSLRKCPMDVGQKQQLIYMALWPRAFHAIGITLLSDTHVRALRTQACKALGWHQAGSQPLIRLSLLGRSPMLDPGFYQLHRVFHDFQRFLSKDDALVELWLRFMEHYDGTWFSGPFSKLLEQMDLVRWHVSQPPFFVDHDGCEWNLLEIPTKLLDSLLIDAWHQYIARSIGGRKDFAGLTGLHWATPSLGSSCSPVQRAQLHALCDGSFMTNDMIHKFDLTKTSRCDLCGQMDSMEHLCLECPRLAAARAPHSAIIARWPDLPRSLTHHLLPSRLVHWPQVKKALISLEDFSGCFMLHRFEEEHVDLFSDGSCLHPTDPARSLGAWSLISATHQLCLASGPLHGLLQTTNRSELMAAWAAVRWATAWARAVTLWTDSAYVAAGFHRLRQDRFDVPDGSNQDLWRQIAQALTTYSNVSFMVCHTPGHMSTQQDDEVTSWLAHWNAIADRQAATAQEQRPLHFRRLWRQYVEELELQRKDVVLLQSLHLDLARLRYELRGSGASDVGPEYEPEEEVSASLEEQGPSNFDLLPLSWQNTWLRDNSCLGAQLGVQILEWFQRHDSTATGSFELSWIEIAAVIFESPLIHPMLSSEAGRWVPPCDGGVTRSSLTIAVRVRFVRTLFRRFSSYFELELPWIDGLNRLGLGITYPVSGVRLRLPRSLVDAAAAVLKQLTARRQIRTCNDLSRPFRP